MPNGRLGTLERVVPRVKIPKWEEITPVLEAKALAEQDVLDLFERLFPQLFDVTKMADVPAEDIPYRAVEFVESWAEEEPEKFIDYIREKGRTADTEALLREYGAPDELIEEIFLPLPPTVPRAEPILPKWVTGELTVYDFWKKTLFKPYAGENLLSKAYDSFVAGIGDVITTSGGTANWLGFEEAGSTLAAIGSSLQRLAPPLTTGEFEMTDMLDPEFWATKVTRALPFALSFAPLAIGGFYGGAAVATTLGLGKIGFYIVGGFSSAALTRPLESALEAGSQYDDAIARGKTPKEAKEEADEVFRNNMVLAGADAFQIAIALAPTPKWVPLSLVNSGLVRTARIGGKMIIVGLSEGGEEVYQDMVQRHARGEEWKLDPVSKEVFAIGMAMGWGMGFGGDVITSIVDKSKGKMSPEVKSKYYEAFREAKAEGFTSEQSELKAVDSIAQTPEGEKIVSETVKEVQEAQVEPGGLEELEKLRTDLAGPSETRSLLIRFNGEEYVENLILETDQKIAELRGEPELVPKPEAVPEVTPEVAKEIDRYERMRGRTGRDLESTPDDPIKNAQRGEAEAYLSRYGMGDIEIAEQNIVYARKSWETNYGGKRLNPEMEKPILDAEKALEQARAIPKPEVGMPEVKVGGVFVNAEGKRITAEKWLPEKGFVEKGKWLLRDAKGTTSQLSPKELAERGYELETKIPKAEFVTPEEAERVGLRLEEMVAEVEGLKEWLTTVPAAKLIKLIKRTGWFKGEISNLTLKQYRDITGKTEIKPNILTADKKHVRWEYALDDIATEIGYESSDVLKEEIERAGESLARIKELEREIAVTEIPEVVPTAPPPVEPPIPPVEIAPVPEGASKRVFDRIQMRPAEPDIVEKFKRGWHKFNVKMVDDLYAIRQFTKEAKKGGLELSIEENPYMLARLLKGITSKSTVFLEKGTFGKKFGKIEKGEVVPNFTGESLEDILKEVKEPALWQDFSTYLVAKRAFDLNLRGIETGISEADSAGTIGEQEEKHSKFPDLADRVYKYQDRLLDYTYEMGLVSKELLGKIRKFGSYVPFYRVFNELQAKGFMGKKMANIAKPIKRIKGSEREIINPLESIVKNTYTLINAANRNQIGIAMANLVDQNPEIADLFERVKTPMARVARVSAEELGVEIEGLSETEADEVVDIFRPSFFVRGDEVTVLIDGKKNYFKIDPDLRDALLTLDREDIGILGRVLGAPAKWLRAGATLSPDFMVRNPARDQMTAFCYSNYGFLPGIDFLRGAAGIIARDADYDLFRMSGAEHSMLVSMDRQYLRKTFDEIVGGKNFTDYVKHPLELFQIISELGEKATRLGEFKAGLRRGATPLEAGYSARNVSLDFAQAGTAARAVNRLIAFFNANIRGWGRMVSSMKEHPTRTSLKIFAGITMPSILLYLANRDDDRWKEIPQWQKDLFWIVLTKDRIWRIPKPFELGIIFGSGPERFLEYLDNKDPKMLKEVLLNTAEAGSPGFIPTALLPIIENLANYSFFRGRELVPPSREKMPPELQYTGWTTEFSKKLGELLKYPPAKIDNIINGWTGGLGRYAVNILDVILKGTGISPDIPEPSPTLADRPVVKAFIVRNPFGSSSESVNRFYETLEDYQKGEKYLKEMLELGNIAKFEDYKGKHPELLFFYDFENDTSYSASARYLRRVARDLSELRKKEDEIYNSRTMSPAEKRSLIEEIDKVRWQVAKRALELFIGEVPVVMERQLAEADNRLGEVIEDVTPLSLDKPIIFDMRKLSADYNNLLESVSVEDIADKRGVPKTVKAWYEKEESEETQLSYVNTPIYKVDTDKEYELLTKRQKALFNLYKKLPDDKKDVFLELNPEATANPRSDWLRANPIENAQLAIWGQAKILSIEAFNEFNRLVKELDIPDDAIPEMTLPPKESVANYFKYQVIGEMIGWNSWEAQHLLATDDKLREFLEREPIETPVRALELKIHWRKTSEQYDLIAKDEDRDVYRLEHPEWVDDMRRVDAIENEASDEIVEWWVERGQLIDKYGANSNQAKLWRYKKPKVNEWAMEQFGWEPLFENEKDLVEVSEKHSTWSIAVQWEKEEEEYEAWDEGQRDFFWSKARKQYAVYKKEGSDYLVSHDLLHYAMDRLARNAVRLGLTRYSHEKNPEKPIALWNDLTLNYVEYRLLPRKPEDQDLWFEDDWFLIEHPELEKAMLDLEVWKQPRDFTKVPTRKVFDKYLEYKSLEKGQPRSDYRWKNSDLDDWLVLKFGYTPIGGGGTPSFPTPKLPTDFEEKMKEIEEKLESIGK